MRIYPVTLFMSGDDNFNRRTLLKSAAVVGVVGSIPVAAFTIDDNGDSGESNDWGGTDSGGSLESGPDTSVPTAGRLIEWDGKLGDEHADHDCDSGYQACWHWVLTRGGQPDFEEVEDLWVKFEDGSESRVSGEQAGQGAYHFYVCKDGGGKITDAEVYVTGGGQNAHLTISGVECEEFETEQEFWQLDFGEGDGPKLPPSYHPDDLMAALGDSHGGVTENPSTRRQQTMGQLGDVDIYEKKFHFDDDNQPTEVTVSFTVDEGAEERYLHLALFKLPGPFDPDEVDQQEYVRSETDAFSGGDSGSLTISLDLS